MSDDGISPETLRTQINAYAGKPPDDKGEYGHYKIYAGALERVLRNACRLAVPEAIIQARPKSVSSFAEKCVRKWAKYKDAVHQLTDLCGARVIVHTLEQVAAVEQFIKANFKVREHENKALLLGEDRFGYRDVHFLVTLNMERAAAAGFTTQECAEIDERVAEVQVRTIVQHAWADILHDRLYKAPLRLSSEAKRTGNLLSAIMEDGDRSFDLLATELDGMAANYTAYASREDVEREIRVQELLLENDPVIEARPRAALRLARLLGPRGRNERVVTILDPYSEPGAAIDEGLLTEIRLELGYALVRVHGTSPGSEGFKRGRGYLLDVIGRCDPSLQMAVANVPRRRSLLAHAHSRLAWSYEAEKKGDVRALLAYRAAVVVEPSNPYHLADQIGFEVYCRSGGGSRDELAETSLIASMRTGIDQAIASCREHALAGTELPYAFFTAGRLWLMLGKEDQALGWYARGLRHHFEDKSGVAADIIKDELSWLDRLSVGAHLPLAYQRVKQLFALAQKFADRERTATNAAKEAAKAADAKVMPDPQPQVLIVVGGAKTMAPEMKEKVRPLLAGALSCFRGKVISGGTTVGIPGLVGDLAEHLKSEGRKAFHLVGYVPGRTSYEAPEDKRYDEFKRGKESDFSASQILDTWEDLFAANVSPGQVGVLGFGGGPLSAVEYRVAFAFGARVAVVRGSQGTADEILADALWTDAPLLMGLPFDVASVRAFTMSTTFEHEREKLQEMAAAFHKEYLGNSTGKLPRNLRPWEKLEDTYRKANLAQARDAVEILRAAGFDVRAAKSEPPAVLDKFTDPEIDRMAELEHGRWNVERLRDGWHPGSPRDDAKKIHDCLVSWTDLPEKIRDYDRFSVKEFPRILAGAGLEVFRRGA